jgi:hypothetical protein
MAAKSKIETTKRQERPPQEMDPVAESSDESFPASDAPAWTTSGDARSSRSGLKKRRKKRG